jgi:hypothetical protein
MAAALAPTLGVDAVVVRRQDLTQIAYDVSMWCGDSGAVLAVENGIAIAMHLAVVVEEPSVEHASHFGVPRATVSPHTTVHSVGKEGRAVVLTVRVVLAAIAAAQAQAAGAVDIRVVNPLRAAELPGVSIILSPLQGARSIMPASQAAHTQSVRSHSCTGVLVGSALGPMVARVTPHVTHTVI